MLRVDSRGREFHGMSHTPTYKAWNNMKKRCINPNHPQYYCYGGRGIEVCKRWKKFSKFLEDMGIRPKGRYDLERKNNNKGYTPSNCIWALHQLNCQNRRTTRLSLNLVRRIRKEKRTIKYWMTLTGASKRTIIQAKSKRRVKWKNA